MNPEFMTVLREKAEPYKDLWQLAKLYSSVEITDCKNYHGMGTENKNIMYNITPDKYSPNTAIQPVSECITQSRLNLSNSIRMLWEQHIHWTALTIISLIEDTPYKDLVIKRLLRNPKDFEAALKPLYGNETAAEFSRLLTDHLAIAADLVKAAKAGDSKGAAEIEKKWYANADEIAHFLGSINPYWSEKDWKDMLHKHLELTKAEAVYWLTKDYQKAINIYDEIEKQALGMADMMTDGIVKQFPNMFMS